MSKNLWMIAIILTGCATTSNETENIDDVKSIFHIANVVSDLSFDLYQSAVDQHGNNVNRFGKTDGTFLPSLNTSCDKEGDSLLKDNAEWIVKHTKRNRDSLLQLSLLADGFKSELSNIAKNFDKQVAAGEIQPLFLLDNESLAKLDSRGTEKRSRQNREWKSLLDAISISLAESHVSDPENAIIASKLSMVHKIACKYQFEDFPQ